MTTVYQHTLNKEQIEDIIGYGFYFCEEEVAYGDIFIFHPEDRCCTTTVCIVTRSIESPSGDQMLILKRCTWA